MKRIRGKIAGVLTAVLLGMAIFPNTVAATGELPGETVAEGGTENLPADPSGTDEGTAPVDEAGEPIAAPDAEPDTQSPDAQEPQNPEESGEPEAQSLEDGTEGEPEVETPGLINYIGVDLPYVQAPAEQKLAVSYGDGTENVTDAKLICVKPDGSEMELGLTNREESLYLFGRTFEESEAGVYKLLRFVYVQDGAEQVINLPDIGINAMFGVNEYYPGYENSEAVDIAEESGTAVPAEASAEPAALAEMEEAGVTPEEVEVSVVSVDVNDVGSAETDVEETLETVAEEVDTDQKVSKNSGVGFADTAAAVLSSVADIVLPASTAKAAENKVVVLDPGHGGSDGGASANGLTEKNLTLKIAQYCKAELEAYGGVTVYMTRTSDKAVGLTERVNMAKNWGADVFVSLHINSAVASAKGVEVWYPNSNYNSTVHKNGKELAKYILDELTDLGLYDRGVKYKDYQSSDGSAPVKYPDGSLADYYSVIRDSKRAGFPGIIVEHAFITNTEDAQMLAQDSKLKQMGIADATGIANYLGLSKGTSVRVTNQNDFAGTADIKANGLGSNGKVKVTHQSTGKTKRYSLSSGSGTIQFKVSDFGNARGSYLVEGQNSNGRVLHSTSFNMADTSCNVYVDPVGNGREYKIVAKFNEKTPSGISAVQIPVWSEENGQDDLIWYSAKEVSSGNWQITVDVSNHRSAGNYVVHSYALMSDGRTQNFLGATSFNVSTPAVAPTLTATTENYDEKAGTFDVIIKNVSSSAGVKEVHVPVWCAADQSDIHWYTAKKQSNGDYKVTVDAANHGYAAGNYTIHVYVTSGNGVMTFGGTAPGVNVKAVERDMKITAVDTDGKEMKYQLTAANASSLGSVKAVQFATWSEEGGQDDIRWYNGSKGASGKWTATADIKNHKTAGRYNVHVYVTLSNGSMKFLGSTTFTVSKPTLSVVSGGYDKGKGIFDVTITNVASVSGVEKIQIPVWCAKNQSDIKWYDAERQKNGSYKATVRMSNHGYSVGKYQVHTYITAGNGVMAFGGAAAAVDVTLPKVDITASDLDGNGTNYALRASNTDIFGAIRGVQFATWSVENGQDDIRWYSGTKNASGQWAATANVKNHGSAGRYNVHVYATLADGRLSFLGSTVFDVPKASVSGIKVEGYNSESGAFKVVVSGAKAPAGVANVQVPVWCAANQNDIKWYEAKKQSDGTYVANVSPANHKSNSGLYKIHVYVTAGNGTLSFVGNTSQMVNVTKTPIMGESSTTVKQMVAYFKQSKHTYPSLALGKGGAGTLEQFCQIYLEEAAAEGVRAEVAFAQSMKETGWLQFKGSIVKIEQFNFAGLGAEDGNPTGKCESFKDIRQGVRAQIQHLKAYASTDPLNNACVDARFKYVKRGCAPYVEWLGQKENPNGYGWATDATYGSSIAGMIKKLITM